MLCLGIESTAHTFGIAIVRKTGTSEFDGWEVLANERKAFTTTEGGMIPAKVSDHHVEHCGAVLAAALTKANVHLADINLVAFSQAPGIGNSLRIGASMARSLALRNNCELIGVNHCVAHLEVGRIFGNVQDPVLLYASGANTQVIALEAGTYRVFGETLDTGVGNFLDTLGRSLGMGFPAGPAIEQAALTGTYHPLPYAVKGMDVAFSGLLTAAEKAHKTGMSVPDICASVQETAFAMLTEIAERALAHTEKPSLVLGGGVACNARLQAMCKAMCDARGVTFYAPQKQFLIDNAAMIALTGIVMRMHGPPIAIEASAVNPRERTDHVSVYWR
jgi:glycoprotease/Kae1 family metallohydrolase